MLIEQLKREYDAMTPRERAQVSRNDLEWLAAMMLWARECMPPELREQLDQQRALLALVSFHSWRRPHGLRLIRGGKS